MVQRTASSQRGPGAPSEPLTVERCGNNALLLMQQGLKRYVKALNRKSHPSTAEERKRAQEAWERFKQKGDRLLYEKDRDDLIRL